MTARDTGWRNLQAPPYELFDTSELEVSYRLTRKRWSVAIAERS